MKAIFSHLLLQICSKHESINQYIIYSCFLNCCCFCVIKTVGNDGDVAKLDLDINAMRFKQDQPQFPRSFCSEPCKPGQAKLQLEGDTCCWLCTNCSLYQYLADEYHCEDCPLGKSQFITFNI